MNWFDVVITNFIYIDMKYIWYFRYDVCSETNLFLNTLVKVHVYNKSEYLLRVILIKN